MGCIAALKDVSCVSTQLAMDIHCCYLGLESAFLPLPRRWPISTNFTPRALPLSELFSNGLFYFFFFLEVVLAFLPFWASLSFDCKEAAALVFEGFDGGSGRALSIPFTIVR